MTYCFETNPQIEECFIIPEDWTDEDVNQFLEDSYQNWDDDQELEAFSLECAFGPND